MRCNAHFGCCSLQTSAYKKHLEEEVSRRFQKKCVWFGVLLFIHEANLKGWTHTCFDLDIVCDSCWHLCYLDLSKRKKTSFPSVPSFPPTPWSWSSRSKFMLESKQRIRLPNPISQASNIGCIQVFFSDLFLRTHFK